MVTREELTGRWNEVKGRLQQHWGQLTEDDLRRAKGSADELVGVVQQKTGATRREVEDFLTNVVQQGSQARERASEAAEQYADVAQQYAAEAGQYMRDNYRRAADVSSEYSERLSHSVRNRPAESLAIAFGLGLVAGALVFFNRRR